MTLRIRGRIVGSLITVGMVLTIVLASRSIRSRASAPQLTLGDGEFAAEFDSRGLTRIVDSATGSYAFRHDDFAFVLDGVAYDGRTLPSPARRADPNRVTYSWTAGPHRVDVVYEVAKVWRFVSKQLLIRSDSPATSIDEITPFRVELENRINDAFVPTSARASLGTHDYGGFLRMGGRGLMALVQNPFLEFESEARSFYIRYKPELEWRSTDGSFVSDRGLLAPYRLTGRRLPGRMIDEWAIGPESGPSGADEAEIQTFTKAVRSSLLFDRPRPLNVFVGWCVNDYQIDIATPKGRVEYERVIDRAAELGAEYVLFAPSNSVVSRREQSTDDWRWEHVLWLGLGQKIRKGEWNPQRDPVPPSIQALLNYAQAKNLKLLAYVYPVLPFAGMRDSSAISSTPKGKRANLASRSWQDDLIETLVAFRARTGVAGFSFDHTFLNYSGASAYAQWAGWQRVLRGIRQRMPDIVIDGRQAYHLYGPWSWLAGNYPHPTFNDEQPESFVPFPDLHFDRVSADRERYTAYRYRNYEFTPSELVPGFITHQTPRGDDTSEMPEVRTSERGVVLTPLRARDWDYLGWKYSLLSSIGVAGLNNVINMIPARDVEENRHFSNADRAWFRRWIDWTRDHQEFLRHTRTILSQPAVGRIDGTSAIVDNRGYLFLFNPNARRVTAHFALDHSIDLGREGEFLLKELHPLDGRLIGKEGSGMWRFGDNVSIELDGQSAVVLELSPVTSVREPLAFGVAGTATIDKDVMRLTGVRGEVGTVVDCLVLMPPGRTVAVLLVNGVSIPLSRDGQVRHATLRFAGTPFHHAQQIGSVEPGFTGGRFAASVTIPGWVFDQLAARRRAWPIPWRQQDLRTTWLAPERLLLYVQIAEPDADWEARLTIDGQPVELQKAYTAIRPVKQTFVGFFADVSHLSSDQPHRIELELPRLRPGQFQGVFLDNIEPEYTDQIVPPVSPPA